MQASTPSAEGVDAAGITAFLDAIEAAPRLEPHGLIVQRHGRRIVEGYWAPHRAGTARLVYSLSKSFTGTALGLAVGEGRLGLDDLVSEHLPDLFVDAAPGLEGLKVRHIASMASGHDRETIGEATVLDRDDPVRGFLRIPPDAEPGSLFMYNQPPVLALATILQRLAGERLVDYLRPRLLEPIGITNLVWAQQSPGIDLGYSGVHTDLDAIARLGQLYLDDGMWDGTRVLPEGWVAEASSVQTPNPARVEPDWQQGYGFQLWRSRHGYRGDGAYGQLMLVLPEQDAVIAFFCCIEDMQAEVDHIWEHVLPAFDGVGASAADDALSSRLAGLALPTAVLRTGGSAPTLTTGTFQAPPPGSRSHRSITSIDLEGDHLVVHERHGSFDIPVSEGWTVAAHVAASAATTPDGHLALDVCFVETPHRLELDLDPDAGTFMARWPSIPMSGTGSGARLSSLRAP